MGHETTAVNVGCKVLPICDAAVTPVASKGGDRDGEKEVGRTSERLTAVARVKQELLRWAAAAKSGKGGSKAWKVHNFILFSTLSFLKYFLKKIFNIQFTLGAFLKLICSLFFF